MTKILVFILIFSLLNIGSGVSAENDDFIKWLDFTPSYEAMDKALELDIKSHNTEKPLNWIELLAYLATKYGGDFSKYKEKDLLQVTEKLNLGETIEALTANMKHYPYYIEAYTAVLGEYVGTYEIQEIEDDNLVWKEKYGLKVFSPIAKTFPFEHYDDFGVGRSYGYKRRHLGHDLMAAVGTPVIAIETSIVEAIGWNQYGGWRVGLRSIDGKRYYYYAHLRKNRPYHCDLKEGEIVKAGDVIGYVGRSGYSTTENTNNIKQSHLHLGIQIIFDESQRQGSKEIWIDVYAISKLLQKNKSEVTRNSENKEYYRRFDFKEELLNSELHDIETWNLNDYSDGDDIFLDAEAGSQALVVSGINSETDTDINSKCSKVPIIMYHRVSKSNPESNRFIITTSQLKSDLDYLKNNGYETVFMKDLISYVNGEGTLPEKPVVLTFDDGNYSDYRYLYPMLKERQMKAVISIIGKPTDEYSKVDEPINYPNLTWAQIKEMSSAGVVEVQNHTYNLHGKNGSQKLKNESEEKYKERLRNDLSNMQSRVNEMVGITPTTFAYPLGKISNESHDVLKELGFLASLSCFEGINIIRQGEPECLFLLKRYVRSNENSVKSFLGKK